ncbi:hypothetical protein ACGFX4_34995 [Kitasatospora sp. NPDC048365]|uniref:hypothetical protein n=1 Tax=Kitasatospora sp. NPDC048365 TaxID=3364050 RepID=UPI00371425A5
MALGELPVAWSLPAADARAGWRALWWSVGPGNELAVMLVQKRNLSRSRHTMGWVGWSVAAPCDGVLVAVSGGVEHRTTVTGIPPHTTHLVLLPWSRFLLVSGRTHQDGTGVWERNALLYSPEGHPVSRFCVGDDIDYILSDRNGSIWTSYGDEGIYGDHPESAPGLARWDTDGTHTWSPRGRLPVWPLGGSAGATEESAAWLAWYSHKGPFVSRVDSASGDVTTYRNPLRGTDGIAVRGTGMLLTRRDHGRPRVELSRAEFLDGTWVITGQEKLTVPGPVVLSCAQGRDGVLWLRAGDTWIRFEV